MILIVSLILNTFSLHTDHRGHSTQGSDGPPRLPRLIADFLYHKYDPRR